MVAKHFSTALVCALTLCLTASVSRGIDIDITFSTSSLPTDFGMTSTSNADLGVNTVAGTYNGQGIWWMDNFGATTLPTENFSQDIIHGTIEITHSAFGTFTDSTLVRLVDNFGSVGTNRNYEMELNVAEDMIRIHPGVDIIDLTAISKTNNDGQKHTYGWDMNRTTNALRMFFDGVQVGDASYTMPNGGEVQSYFGDGNGGSPAGGLWDRWTLKEGVIPEPTTLGLLLPAVCVLFTRRRSRLHTGRRESRPSSP